MKLCGKSYKSEDISKSSKQSQKTFYIFTLYLPFLQQFVRFSSNRVLNFKQLPSFERRQYRFLKVKWECFMEGECQIS